MGTLGAVWISILVVLFKCLLKLFVNCKTAGIPFCCSLACFMTAFVNRSIAVDNIATKALCCWLKPVQTKCSAVLVMSAQLAKEDI